MAVADDLDREVDLGSVAGHMTHLTTIDVRFAELDPYGHVNHSVYVTYLEVGRTDALARCGVAIDKIAEAGYQMVVTAIEVKFRRPGGPGDTLTVKSTIGEMKRATGVWHQTIQRGDEVLVTAKVMVGITNSEGRPCRPPDWLFPALVSLQDS